MLNIYDGNFSLILLWILHYCYGYIFPQNAAEAYVINGQPCYADPYIPVNYYANNGFTPDFKGFGDQINVKNDGLSNIADKGGKIWNNYNIPIDYTSPVTTGGSTNGVEYPTNEQQFTDNYSTDGGVIDNANENLQNKQTVGNLQPYIPICENCEHQTTNV